MTPEAHSKRSNKLEYLSQSLVAELALMGLLAVAEQYLGSTEDADMITVHLSKNLSARERAEKGLPVQKEGVRILYGARAWSHLGGEALIDSEAEAARSELALELRYLGLTPEVSFCYIRESLLFSVILESYLDTSELPDEWRGAPVNYSVAPRKRKSKRA